MNLTTVPSYKTSDGKLFPTKSEAIPHEGMISLRGAFQRRLSRSITATADISSLSRLMADDPEEFINLLQQIKKAKKRAEKSS